MRLFELENANVIAARKAFIVQVGLTSISLSLSQAARMWNVHTLNYLARPAVLWVSQLDFQLNVCFNKTRLNHKFRWILIYKL